MSKLDFILELAKNPIVVIGFTVIVLALLITQRGVVGEYARKLLKLTTEKETVKFAEEIRLMNRRTKAGRKSVGLLFNEKFNRNKNK